MTENKKIMVTICPNVEHEQKKILIDRLTTEFPISFILLNTINELLPLLSSETFYCDYISIDLEQLHCVNNVDVFAVLDTLATLLACTHVKDDTQTLCCRETKIVILVGTKTPTELIKEIMSLPMISFIGLRSGDGYSDDEVSNSLRSIIINDNTLPAQVQEMLTRKKRTDQVKNFINLTPRQRQIFNIVASRGVSNKVIAKMLNISESTVKLHMGALLKKYKVRNRTQLAVFAKDHSECERTIV